MGEDFGREAPGGGGQEGGSDPVHETPPLALVWRYGGVVGGITSGETALPAFGSSMTWCWAPPLWPPWSGGWRASTSSRTLVTPSTRPLPTTRVCYPPPFIGRARASTPPSDGGWLAVAPGVTLGGPPPPLRCGCPWRLVHAMPSGPRWLPLSLLSSAAALRPRGCWWWRALTPWRGTLSAGACGRASPRKYARVVATLLSSGLPTVVAGGAGVRGHHRRPALDDAHRGGGGGVPGRQGCPIQVTCPTTVGGRRTATAGGG